MVGVLDSLGLKYRTDKASDGHNYLIWYEKYLESLRNEKLTILEIGVGDGSSLFTWRDYFLQATIVGMDQNDLSHLAEERIKIEIGDQGSEADLIKIAAKYVPLNIIIDDGSHNPDHQILSYKTLLPRIPKGGLYILEDATDIQTVDFLNQIGKEVLSNPNGISSRIESISFYRDTTITCLK